ncbi:uncharacterized protein BJ212DRAFT_1299099 [Suillus subaureus]|uniref:Uncharacterized protein n=1 Tax=Suillus subaureus TaxID=48587 RepID=A0A9P7JDY6_9AGAM|nr:uncharacterized protein BJ212DRAFT_1299099 [Suillus subaureus]KAG1817549.1 hypothetical protein BJ212DRAFT_1299099 [Suillus subaureus]
MSHQIQIWCNLVKLPLLWEISFFFQGSHTVQHPDSPGHQTTAEGALYGKSPFVHLHVILLSSDVQYPGPDFIIIDIINKVKLLIVEKGHYQDLLSALEEAVSGANIHLISSCGVTRTHDGSLVNLCMPLVYNKQKDTAKEKGIVHFFNKGSTWIDKIIANHHGSNTFIHPQTGVNMAAPIRPGCCKPDTVLMDTTKPINSIEWADVISVLEIKYYNTKVLMEQAMEYISIGGTFKFLNCMAWFKHADLEFLGYDKSIVRHSSGFKMALKGESESAHETIADVVSVIYNSNSAIGRSTRVLGLTYQPSSTTETDHLIVKDLLEDSGCINETCKLLGSKLPEHISKMPEEAKLTEELFQSWGIWPEWDDLNPEGMCSWHLPIWDDWFSVEALEMTDGNNGHQALDSVPVILQDMTIDSNL